MAHCPPSPSHRVNITTNVSSRTHTNTNNNSSDRSAGEYVVLTAMVAIIVITLLGNSCVLTVIIRSSFLRRIFSSFFLLSLCVVDLMSALLAMPMAAVSFWSRNWALGTQACATFTILLSVCIFASMSTLSAIWLERFYAISQPMHHAGHMSLAKTLTAVVVLWTWSLVLAACHYQHLSPYEMCNGRIRCFIIWNSTDAPVFSWVVIFLFFLLPLTIMTFVNLGIFLVAKKVTRQVRPDQAMSTHTFISGITSSRSLGNMFLTPWSVLSGIRTTGSRILTPSSPAVLNATQLGTFTSPVSPCPTHQGFPSLQTGHSALQTCTTSSSILVSSASHINRTSSKINFCTLQVRTTVQSGSNPSPKPPNSPQRSLKSSPNGPTSPSSEPTLPTSDSTFPPSGPTLPTSDSTLPTSEPTLPTSEPTLPTSEPTLPTSEPTLPTSEPTLPTSEPTLPTSEPTLPTSGPTLPTSEPTYTSHTTDQSTSQSDPSTFQATDQSTFQSDTYTPQSDPSMSQMNLASARRDVSSSQITASFPKPRDPTGPANDVIVFPRTQQGDMSEGTPPPDLGAKAKSEPSTSKTTALDEDSGIVVSHYDDVAPPQTQSSGMLRISFDCIRCSVRGWCLGGRMKAVRTLLMLLMAFLVLWGPYFGLYAHYVLYKPHLAQAVEVTALWLMFSSFALNPFLYGWMNLVIREELQDFFQAVFCSCRCCPHKPRTRDSETVELSEGPSGEDFFQFLERTNPDIRINT